jgi:hypothetical protein
MIIFCWLRGLWWSLKGFITNGAFPWSGHVDVDEEVHANVTLTLSRCEDCGKRDFTWRKTR